MIKILSAEEAKKIAAGEVIDRPAALVRELMDNALDAGSQNIEVSIEGGGINKIEVIDDGAGMDRDDLALCVKTHATSKIQTLDDLSRTVTLGFRGEALAAAAAVARLQIITSTDGREAWLLETPGSENKNSNSEDFVLTQTRRNRGTSVRAFGLFDCIPARKRFLKRESSEAALCRQIFTEKALAFPGISLRFIQDGHQKLQLLPCAHNGIPPLQKRFGELILGSNERSFLHTAETGGNGFSATIVFGGPEIFRRDRRQQYIFANKRRIQDFGLIQALEYGLAGFFPNDSHPAGAVFVEVDPALADFNIHPAKREVRFAEASAIHHSITSALRNYTGTNNTNREMNSTSPKYSGRNNSGAGEFNFNHSLAMEALLTKQEEFAPLPKTASEKSAVPETFAAEKKTIYDGNIRFVGQLFDLFILAEKGDILYLIDQHAAHERLLYDQYISAPPVSQELLVPIPFTTPSEESDCFLESKKDELSSLGIAIKSEGKGAWLITALPAAWKTADPAEELLALQFSDSQSITENLIANIACRTAIKDGDCLDNEAAFTLAKKAIALADTGTLPRCPHGRPLWTELRREDLFKAVRR